jgi:predicted metal-dependent phosphotriesterase family hydrolase
MAVRGSNTGTIDVRRRLALRLLGAGAGLGTAAWLGWLDGVSPVLPAQAPTGSAKIPVPPGGIIRTITGDIDPNSYTGGTLMHEHLGNGRPSLARGGGGTLPVESPTQDAAWMAEELTLARKNGNLGCIVAAGTNSPGPDDARYLTTLSQASGVRIVAAAAYYMPQAYPSGTETLSEDEIAEMVAKGAQESRLGAFGELGCANDEADLQPIEKKVFRAFAKAQVRTSLPIFTHTNYSTGANVSMDMALRQLDVLESAGGKPSSIAIGHVCCLDDPMADVARRLGRRGAFVAFDRMTRQQQWVPDAKRIEMIKVLLEAGLVDNLLISSDYIGRINAAAGEVPGYPGSLHARDGGPGYARPFILAVPQMMKAGISVDAIRKITVDNPRRFLTFVPTRGG